MRFIKKNRNKNFIQLFLLLLLFSGVVFSFFDVRVAFAGPPPNTYQYDESSSIPDIESAMATANTSEDMKGARGAYSDSGGGSWWDFIFKPLLLGIFTLFGYLTSVAITLFEWVIKPENYSGTTGVMNLSAVYEMWKFIRDFFNLFFILVLLYTAFTLVFQISKDFKKTLLSIVLAALFINFSYPVSRALIDMTNVPMYFFANIMAGSSGEPADSVNSVFESALSASKIKNILIPGSGNGGSVKTDEIGYERFFVAIIFIFLFGITLLVLSVMFVIRLVALVILIIFSPVGFVASIIPGLGEYSNMWWKNFWKYAFFGPAAMLMLLVAVRFMSALGDERTGIFKTLKVTTTENLGANTSPTWFASMAVFAVPIIMLWMAMSLAQTMSLAGASSVVGQGQTFSRWLGRKTYNNALTRGSYNNPVTRGTAKGIKEGAENNRFLKFVTPKYWKDVSQQKEERIAARIGGGEEGLQRVRENQHNKKVAEAEKKMEEERVSEAELRRRMNDHSGTTDRAEVEAAARILSKKDKLRNSADVQQASNAMTYANADLNSPDITQEKIAEITKRAGAEIYQSGQELSDAIGRLGDDTKAIAALIDKASGSALDLNAAQYNAIAKNPAMKAKLDSKLRKEGKTSSMINAQVASGTNPQVAIDNLLNGMTPAEVAKQDIFTNPAYQSQAIQYVRVLQRSTNRSDTRRAIEIRKHMTKAVNDSI